MENYFEIKNLKVGFKTIDGMKSILDIGHMSIEKGKTFGVVGESGTGKTVLALTILKLISTPPGIIESGEIYLDGEDLLKKKQSKMRKIRGRKISMIFQDPMSTLNPVFTVGEQIIRVIRNKGKVSRKMAHKKALEVVNLVKLPDAENILGKYPHELSGGQRQRIIIAIALSCDAEFLIADEPTRNLDVTIQAGIIKLISELQKKLKVTVLFIANNLGLVNVICDNVCILHQGKVVEQGKVREVLRNPLHPYTTLLLNALPKNKDEDLNLSRFISTKQSVLKNKGCDFLFKCQMKKNSCEEEPPCLAHIEGTHFVACHKYLEGIVNE